MLQKLKNEGGEKIQILIAFNARCRQVQLLLVLDSKALSFWEEETIQDHLIWKKKVKQGANVT